MASLFPNGIAGYRWNDAYLLLVAVDCFVGISQFFA